MGEECTICCEDRTSFIQLPCTHQFCETCIRRWKYYTCPYCRSPYNRSIFGIYHNQYELLADGCDLSYTNIIRHVENLQEWMSSRELLKLDDEEILAIFQHKRLT
jgi:hypothetical protein